MPVLNPLGTPPYDPLNTVLNAARVRLNDAIQSLGGDVLTNNQPFTQVMANIAWRRLQETLADLGYSRLRREAILTNCPVVASIDPASQVSVSWASYFDGVSYYSAPVLPQDLILPLRLWERPSGQNAEFAPMQNWLDGLPTRPKLGRNFVWEWREDAIYMPGALTVMDLRIRYAAYLPDFATVGETEWYDQPVSILRSLDPFAYYICSEAANARGDLDGSQFDAKAEATAKLIFNREVGMKERVNLRRIPRSGRGC